MIPYRMYLSSTLESHALKKGFFKKPSFASSRFFHVSLRTTAPCVSLPVCLKVVAGGRTGSQKMTEEKRDGKAVAAKAIPAPPSECPIPTMRRSRKMREEGMGEPGEGESVSRSRREAVEGSVMGGRKVEGKEVGGTREGSLEVEEGWRGESM